eukprot:jgi/Chlat1/740/Chrsp104S01220
MRRHGIGAAVSPRWRRCAARWAQQLSLLLVGGNGGGGGGGHMRLRRLHKRLGLLAAAFVFLWFFASTRFRQPHVEPVPELRRPGQFAPVNVNGQLKTFGSTFYDGEPYYFQSELKYTGSRVLHSHLLFVGILSSPENGALRRAIRKSWLQWPGDWEGKFFIGHTSDTDLNFKIRREAVKYGDIVLIDVPEHYRNIPAKALKLFEYATVAYRHYDFILKADDDTFVRLDRLLEELPNKPKEALYWGYSIGKFRPIRDTKNKWYVSPEEFPDAMVPGPVALSGSGYVVSRDLAYHAVKRAQDPKTKMVPLEDVNTAILITDLLQLKRKGPISDNRFFYVGDGCQPNAVVVHYTNAVDMQVKYLALKQQGFKYPDPAVCIGHGKSYKRPKNLMLEEDVDPLNRQQPLFGTEECILEDLWECAQPKERRARDCQCSFGPDSYIHAAPEPYDKDPRMSPETHIALVNLADHASQLLADAIFRFGCWHSLCFYAPQPTDRLQYLAPIPVEEDLCRNGPSELILQRLPAEKEWHGHWDQLLQWYRVAAQGSRLVIMLDDPVHRQAIVAAMFKHYAGYTATLQVNDASISQSFHGYVDSAARNQQAASLGLSSVAEVNSFIQNQLPQFALVLDASRFDEALVLMRRAFNWRMIDIAYLAPFNGTHYSTPHKASQQALAAEAEAERSRLQTLDNLDHMLYQAATQRFNVLLGRYNQSFTEELMTFRRKQNWFHAFCQRQREGGLGELSGHLVNFCEFYDLSQTEYFAALYVSGGRLEKFGNMHFV